MGIVGIVGIVGMGECIVPDEGFCSVLDLAALVAWPSIVCVV